MIVFPNAKINLGLNIVARRSDGYHDLDMVMLPVGWRDILEFVPARSGTTTLTVTGRAVDCPTEKNLVYKAWARLNEYIDGDLPAVDIFLHKVIPDGAGLGGGSSDAAFTLVALNDLFALGLTKDQLCEIASKIGADCPFFIYNRPMVCTGIGTIMTPIDIDFGQLSTVVIAKPIGVGVSTAEAYAGVSPSVPSLTTDAILTTMPPYAWKGHLTNGFERHIFEAKPVIAAIKNTLYEHGAIYASMSGSGAAVYGLFDDAKLADQSAASLTDCDIFVGQLEN